MKKLFLLAFSIGCMQQNFAQDNFEALYKRLGGASSDSSRGNILRSQYMIFDLNPDSAVLLCLQHKAHFELTGNRQGVGWTLWGLSGAFINKGDYEQGTKLGLQSLKIFESLKDTFGILYALNTCGISIILNGDPASALTYFKKILNYIGLFKAERIGAVAKSNIAESYLRLGKPDSSLSYLSAFMEYTNTINDASLSATAFNDYGEYFRLKKEYELALPYFKKASDKFEKSQNHFDRSDNYNHIAAVYFSLQQYDSSLANAYHAVELSSQNNFNQFLMDGYNWLYKNYERLKKNDSAFNYLKLSLATKDSLFSEEKARKVQSLTFTEEIRQQEIATKEAIAAKERRDNLQLLFIAIFIVTFLIIVFLMGAMHVKPRTAEFLGLLGLLLFFEFINLTIHPFVGELTHHTPVLMLLILVSIAALLVPAHHKLIGWIKEKLASNARKKKIKPVTKNAITT